MITVLTPASDLSDEVSLLKRATSNPESFNSYPNPFNDRISFNYTLSQKEKTTLEIRDITGRLVKTLVSDVQEAGQYRVDWNPGEETGGALNSGIYIGTLKSGEFSKSLKLIFQKK